MTRHITLRSRYIPALASILAISFAAPLQSAEETACFPPPNSVAASIAWQPCPEDSGFPKSILCARYSVPIDWDQPERDHFELGLVKLSAPSENATSKVGYLFVNPGGPGASATGLVKTIAERAETFQVILDSFDIIGLDPRGVGFSGQVKCDPKIFVERVSLFPKTQEDFDALADKNKRLGESCRNLTGPLIEHVDTISTAKDHEAVRIALGNEPFNFLGLSYGAMLGAQYASLFPDNIRTLALDGITQHSLGEAANILVESTSYDTSLQHFFEAASTTAGSPFQGQDMEAFWSSLLSNATEKTIPAAGCDGTKCLKDVNAEDILFKAQQYMVYASADVKLGASWGFLASALYNTSQGDATAFATSLTDPIALSAVAIGCLDWTTTPTLSASLQKQAMGEVYTPLTHGASQSYQIQHQCIGWPIPVINPPTKLNIRSNTTALLVNSETDPQTGYPWAIGMLEEFENKVLVTRKGDGHTSFPLGGETAKIMAEYLITAKAPEEGLFLDS